MSPRNFKTEAKCPPLKLRGGSKGALFVALFAISILLRFSRILPNFEFVTTSLVLSSLYLTRKQSLSLIFSILLISDLILGNTSIFLFTWSGFLIPALVINKLNNFLKIKNLSAGRQDSKLKIMLPLGLLSNIFFYLWTNFGVWALDSWGMYPKTLGGLISCYINGLPFLKTQLESTLIFLPLSLFTLSLIGKFLVRRHGRDKIQIPVIKAPITN